MLKSMNAVFPIVSSTLKALIHSLIIIGVLLSFINCSSIKNKQLQKTIHKQLHSGNTDDYFQGIMIYDPQNRDTVYRYNSNKYFTPASNTKIITLYSSLKTLPQHIPALKYVVSNDTLFMQGTGDPSLLHPFFKDSTVLQFAKGYPHVSLHLNNFKEKRFGPGWAWEDYDLYFSPERSSFPIYGNVVSIFKSENQNKLVISPQLFKEKVIPIPYTVNREQYNNIFYFNTERKDTLESPFILDSTLIKNLLEDALQKKVSLTQHMPEMEKQLLYSVPSDSLYKRMMYESDNFLAEQLLILASSTLSDTLNSGKAREYILENYLNEIKQPPRWVDGSGLSRYNLFTPETFVYVLSSMYEEVPRERLFNLFPIGGETGTLKNGFEGAEQPYIYAKTGSLGNNYCLSGYLLTKSGKTLIFSFMNNHFRISNEEVKQHMQYILEMVRDNY